MVRTKAQQPVPTALDPLPRGTQAILRTGIEAVAYHVPVEPSSSDQPEIRTTIVLPVHSRWTSGLHFHTKHTEYLRLVKGSIFVELDGETRILSAKAGGQVSLYTGEAIAPGLIIEVPKFARHNWGRVETYLQQRRFSTGRRIYLPEDKNTDAVVEEWTDPEDIGKPLFFWNLNGVILNPSTALSRSQKAAQSILGCWWIPLQLFIIFWQLDNWPVLTDFKGVGSLLLGSKTSQRLQRTVEYVTALVVLFFASILGGLLAIKGVSKDRTPAGLWRAYEREGI